MEGLAWARGGEMEGLRGPVLTPKLSGSPEVVILLWPLCRRDGCLKQRSENLTMLTEQETCG